MGIAMADDCRRSELDDLLRLAERASAPQKDPQDFHGRKISTNSVTTHSEEFDHELVCVTSGVSFLGLAVVNHLLLRGYSVRIIVDNPEERERVREMEWRAGGGGMQGRKRTWSVTANLMELGSLVDAFEGCRCVFHTSSFIDPAGLTGYSKWMVDVEEKVSENVMEACAISSSVQYCVFTSSLLACIWRDGIRPQISPLVDHHCWTDHLLCVHKKLWYALGKLRAEKAAWRIAKERDIKLATICPALITAPDISIRFPNPTIAYLKGAEEMFEQGVLGTVDISTLAEAHVTVYEAMAENNAHLGRYICFDQIISTQQQALTLASQIGLPVTRICQDQSSSSSSSAGSSTRFQLSNERLSNLTSGTPARCFFEAQLPK